MSCFRKQEREIIVALAYRTLALEVILLIKKAEGHEE